ncbi:hypothetical protein HYC85_015657 [Camellia sinensis]|uniref:NAC domain-containing protein n=1 Tax=Camellia sinensis TaxID=4442 RepID=A0A7J7GXH8_CAMSI|nr:hypothetical protein HYC85_015657 [Camellia sinensis]
MQQQVQTTPTGQWKATREVDEVIHEGKIVGLKKFFVFDKGNGPTESRTGWLMHEYSVHHSIIPIHKVKNNL